VYSGLKALSEPRNSTPEILWVELPFQGPKSLPSSKPKQIKLPLPKQMIFSAAAPYSFLL